MSKRIDQLDKILDLLNDTRQHAPAAIRRLMDARPALAGAVAYDSTGGSSDTSSVEALALTPDPIAPQIAELDKLLRRQLADAQRLDRIIAAWTPRQPTDRDRREVERANDPTIREFCEHCTPHRRPADRLEVAHTGTVGDRLSSPEGLCAACYAFTWRNGRKPRPRELR